MSKTHRIEMEIEFVKRRIARSPDRKCLKRRLRKLILKQTYQKGDQEWKIAA